MPALSFLHRVIILIALFIFVLGGVLNIDPVPQDPDYHHFADMRSWWGLSNFGDVVSNFGFAIVGVLGLSTLMKAKGRQVFDEELDSRPYFVFFSGIVLVSLGSAYYHLSPDNNSLLWDRLPMTLAFMSLFAAVISDRIDQPTGVRFLLPLFVMAGAMSLLYWGWTESTGMGDLRFYGLVQFFPILALPVICWLFPKSKYTGERYLVWIVFWYGVAKALEYFDSQVYVLLGETISGHSLKHVAAAAAAYTVLKMIMNAKSDRVNKV